VQTPTAPDERLDVLVDNPKPVPLHESAEKIDAVGRRELSLDLSPDARLISSVDEQGCGRQRYFGSSWEANRARTASLMEQRVEKIP